MESQPKNKILLTGLYFSGSGAVADMLSEYSVVDVIPGEFDDFRRAGMMGDILEGKVSNGYNSNIKKASLNLMYGLYGFNPNPHPKKILKYLILIFFPYFNIKIYRRIKLLKDYSIKIELENEFEKKILICKDWIDRITNIYNDKKDLVLFDQPIFFHLHEKSWPLVFSPFKLIVVVRDPRDQISELIRKKLLYSDIETPTRGLLQLYGSDRFAVIKYELELCIARLKRARELRQAHGEKKVKILSIENLVLNYDKAKEEIENFLEISSASHYATKKKFNPDISRQNIGIYKNILTQEEVDYIDSYLAFFEIDQV